jgi:hypothetical protein
VSTSDSRIGALSADVLQRLSALDLDARARDVGLGIARALLEEELGCVLVYGPTFSGKTQAAVVARAAIDPSGEASLHTSAAILNTNAPLAPKDRSAQWQTWTDALRFKDTAPKLVVIDEAGSSACPNPPSGLDTAAASRLLSRWRDSGTKFIVIGHDPDRPSAWAAWLSNGASATCEAQTGVLRKTARTTEREAVDLPRDAKRNPIAAQNALGAQGAARMRQPVGNVLFVRTEEPRAVLDRVLAAVPSEARAALDDPERMLSVRNQIQIALALTSAAKGTHEERMLAWVEAYAPKFDRLLVSDVELKRMLVAAWPTHKDECLAEVRRALGI